MPLCPEIAQLKTGGQVDEFVGKFELLRQMPTKSVGTKSFGGVVAGRKHVDLAVSAGCDSLVNDFAGKNGINLTLINKRVADGAPAAA